MTIDPDELAARLDRLDESFKNAPADPGYAKSLPAPGIYQGLLREVDFFEAKSDGSAFLKIVYEITISQDPQYKGWPLEMIYSLEPPPELAEMKLGFLKRDLRTLGIDVEADDFSFAQVRPGSAIWDAVLDVPVELAVVESKKLDEKTGKPFVNVYLNERLGDALPSDVPFDFPEGEAVAAGKDDDVPFLWDGPMTRDDLKGHVSRW
jgi:hypothetical protein